MMLLRACQTPGAESQIGRATGQEEIVAIGIQVTFDCADPDRLARFWAEALDYAFPDPPAGFDTRRAY